MSVDMRTSIKSRYGKQGRLGVCPPGDASAKGLVINEPVATTYWQNEENAI